jgi:hypothetical protein
MAWRKQHERFPAPLRQFIEAEWPPVDGECLGGYSCRANGYGQDCAPMPGAPCGQACYDHLAGKYPDRPEILAAAKKSDAYERYHRARLNWIGDDGDGWLTEFIDGHRVHNKIRYAPFRDRPL